MGIAAIVEKKRMGAAEVRSCIQGYFGLGGVQYAVLFEVPNGTGGRADRFIDAVVMSLWPSLGLELVGIEIKCDRGDWRREYMRPQKASPVFDYFDRWYLIAEAHVAKQEELPPTWGWLVPENGTLRVAQKAEKNQNIKPIDRNMLAALMRRVAKSDDSFVLEAKRQARDEINREQEKTVAEEVLRRMGDARGDVEIMKKLRNKLKEDGSMRWWDNDLLISAICAVVKSGVHESYNGLDALHRDLTKFAERIEQSIGTLQIQKHKRK